MERITEATQSDSALIREIFTYWQGKCRPGRIPRRSDIDPGEISAVLPNLLIVDFEQEPFRVKFRLVGTKVVEVTGYEFTGCYLDEIAARDVEGDFLECYRVASREKIPVLTRITWRFDAETTGEYDFCVLPLDDDGCVATRAIAVECYAQMEKHVRLWPTGPARGGG